jgi:hypothetical protein
MLLEVAFAIGLATGQDTCSIDSVSVFTSTYYVACAGDFSNWSEVLDFRDLANKEGFGSNAMLRADSTYSLSFVLYGDSIAVSTQLDRLNELLKLSLSARQITFGDVRRQYPISIEFHMLAEVLDSIDYENISLSILQPIVYAPLKDTTFITVSGDSLTPSVANIDSIMPPSLGIDPPIEPKELRDSNVVSQDSTIESPDSLLIATNEIINVAVEQSEEESAQAPEVTALKVMDDVNQSLDLSKNAMDTTQIVERAEDLVVADTGKVHEPSKERLFVEGVNYQIVFGSYTDVASAKEYLKQLKSEGFDASIRSHKGFYRVGLLYEYYPEEELIKYRETHAPCWLVTIANE